MPILVFERYENKYISFYRIDRLGELDLHFEENDVLDDSFEAWDIKGFPIKLYAENHKVKAVVSSPDRTYLQLVKEIAVKFLSDHSIEADTNEEIEKLLEKLEHFDSAD